FRPLAVGALGGASGAGTAAAAHRFELFPLLRREYFSHLFLIFLTKLGELLFLLGGESEAVLDAGDHEQVRWSESARSAAGTTRSAGAIRAALAALPRAVGAALTGRQFLLHVFEFLF